MRQQEIQDAVTAYLTNGDIEPWKRVLDGVRDGTVIAEASKSLMTFRAVTWPRRAEMSEALSRLREESGLTYQQIADATEISMSAVIRNLRGQALTQWPLMALLIRTMGGAPEEFRAAYDRAAMEPLAEGAKPRKRRM